MPSQGTLLKARFGEWSLITATNGGSERFLVGSGAANILTRLFSGQSVRSLLREQTVSEGELLPFLDLLLHERLIEFSHCPRDFSNRCHIQDPPLDSINVLLTNACNLHCRHCYLESGSRVDNEVDGITWIRVLREAQALGAFLLNVSGGEPLLHPQFRSIAEYIASTPTYHANLNTNGTLITAEVAAFLAESFDSIQISIDDSVEARHDAFRGAKGCFARAIHAIEALVRAGAEVNVGCTITKDNFSSLDSLVDLCESSGVTCLNLGLLAEIGRARPTVSTQLAITNCISGVQKTFREKLVSKMCELSMRNGRLRILLPFRVDSPSRYSLRRKKRFICSGDNNQTVFVMADGTIIPCDKLPPTVFGCGNVRRNSLSSGWTSKKMRQFKLMSPKQLPHCRGCPMLRACGGPCVARAFHSGGSLESRDRIACAIASCFAQSQCR